MILVSGVTGRVGQATAGALLRDGHAVRGLVRDSRRLEDKNLDGLEVATGDLAEASSLDGAMSGVSSALLVTANSERQLELEGNFVAAAKKAGVRHIVKISSMEAGPSARAPIPKIHYAVEELIRQSGMDWTMLQPNFFMQNLLMYAQSIAASDQFALPLGTARAAFVDCRDVGEAAAAVLCGNGHENRTYTLTGKELQSFRQVESVLTTVCGRKIRYVDQPPEEFRAFLAQFVKSDWHVNAICELFAEIKAGALESTSKDLANLLGRAPTTLEAFIQRYRMAFGQ
ncbi:MAG: SDR family oxidoreductase [Woeseiaceae bacterium]